MMFQTHIKGTCIKIAIGFGCSLPSRRAPTCS